MSSQKCSFWQALSAATCCFYRSSCVQVQLSKERCLMEGGADRLCRELEEELKQSSDILSSHGWYHGGIPRQVAERALCADGDFLVRDSVSSPGQYVLTCRWRDTPLHFKIMREQIPAILTPGAPAKAAVVTPRVQFRFEGEGFDDVQSLVCSYVGSRLPVSAQSGAVISRPVNRTLPMRLLEARCRSDSIAQTRPHQGRSSRTKECVQTKRFSLNLGDNGGTVDASLIRAKQRSGSHPHGLDYLRERLPAPLQSHQSESRLLTGPRARAMQPNAIRLTPLLSPLLLTGSEPLLSPMGHRRPLPESTFPLSTMSCPHGSDSQLHNRPPPKPSRAPSIAIAPGGEGYYCELHPVPASAKPNNFVERLRAGENAANVQRSDNNVSMWGNRQYRQECLGISEEFCCPEIETSSTFRPNSFTSILLPSENKPLDRNVLRTVKEVFVAHNPRTIAKHIFKMDVRVARITEVSDNVRRKMGVNSGLELITLPHGKQLRLDLLERYNTLALGIAVDILGCTGSVSERAEVLSKTIQLANELKTTIGDLFGFAAIMRAIDMPQIKRLEKTWMVLRQSHTNSALTYEKKLKPFLKSLNEGQEGLTLSATTFPHVLPLLLMLEQCPEPGSSPDIPDNGQYVGLENLLAYLANGRNIAANSGVYASNAQSCLHEFQQDERLLEIFSTDFALRLLWGSKGTEMPPAERYTKFEHILTVLSQKLEPPVPQSEL
uniref:breast cancer anti-estrogen resistance protein 3 homolog n=1 Tax=Myxine glutinosa TaxID=7769 RepID=UPI00358E18A1